MTIGPNSTRIIITLDNELLAWVNAQAEKDNRDRSNWIVTLIKREREAHTPEQNREDR